MSALTRWWSWGLLRYGNCEWVAEMTLLSKLLSFKYVAPSQQASAWMSLRRGVVGCWHLSLLGRARLCDVGVRVGCRDRPETDMTGPLTRARLHAGSNTAVQHKQDFCSLHLACSETHSWQLRSLRQCVLKATLWDTGFSTMLITVAWLGLQNTNTENQMQL